MSTPRISIDIDALRAAAGADAVLTEPDDMGPYLRDWRGKYTASALAVIRPKTTAAMAAAVGWLASERIAMVPQGGNTGLVGGGFPFQNERAVILSTDRMTAIRALDPAANTITVEAGAILADVQAAADAADRFFPLSLGAEGSCRIGGNIGTNAGGILTLRYGNMREQVLGLEAVLPDGRIWNGLNALRKNNTGYDLKHLFIGAEGTLGVVTAAVLKLVPRPRARFALIAGLSGPRAALDLLNHLQARSGGAVEAFELFARQCLDFALAHIEGTRDPLDAAYPWYALAEIATGDVPGDRDNSATSLTGRMEAALGDAFEAEMIADAAIAQNEAQRQDFWFLREAIVEAQRFAGGSIKHDISVPLSALPDFVDQALAAVEARLPGTRPCVFGHLGDGNLHFNLTQPEAATREAFLDRWEEMNTLIHDLVAAHGGSFSAEHGVGRMKTDAMTTYKGAVELDLMRAVKHAIDPLGLMNPGKVLPR